MPRYQFDAFSLWGNSTCLSHPNVAPLWEKIEAILSEAYPDAILSGSSMALDSWLRGMLDLTEDQAQRMKKAVEEWNAWMEDEETGYNAFYVGFLPATGLEHTIQVKSPNGHYNESWQWN